MSTLKRKGETLTNGADTKKPKANGSIASFFSAPKSAAGNGSASASPAAKFDKQKWLAGLTAEQKQLLKLEIETLHESWLALLKDDITSKEFLELKKFLDRETNAGRKWFPPKEDVYSWSRHTPFHDVKVVIVGQDPYHNDRQAHGLAFSVRPPTPAPPSLKNMYIALKKDYPSFVPPPDRGGLLTPWADRGVLMLNTCLTVRAHEANSHSNRGWERFTQKIIDLVAQKRTRGVVFMAWGTPAGKRVQKVDKQRHLILQSVHPSPLSASRGFFDCSHFRAANEWLIKRYGEDGEIDWALSPGATTKAAPAAAASGGASVDGTESVKTQAKSEVKKEANGSVAVEMTRTTEAEEDVDSDDEAALEEALRLAEAEVEKEE
ncbi:uracil-DNA glycosylase [Metarhizium album ARSEF 1941]|uniref:Uracil-DNA glycosylase n=1 Tax=Metarhizium album (strain ARSEF 1941) TaxID=1081103 RepID=A0A0B2WL77_METAS|nr:uracil-DNA glycosylase [Metarhizium album ARSEF 1941]KHN96801.1 uracil-DNA glycosylase [Metarhizium album ARSEF 1941]